MDIVFPYCSAISDGGVFRGHDQKIVVEVKYRGFLPK